MKSTKIFDLMFFRALLVLATCLFANVKMLLILTSLIRTIICFLDRPFVVMFNWSLTSSLSLMILWISLIFFTRRLEKSFLSFRMSEILEPVVWAYNLSQIRYSLVVILELNSVSGVQYKGMMTNRWWKVSTGIIDVVKSKV